MEITVEGAEPDDRPQVEFHWRTVTLIVTLVGVLGFGGWWAIDRFTGIERQIELLIQDYNGAWNSGDGRTVRALMTPTGRHVDGRGQAAIAGEALERRVEELHALGFVGSYTGSPIFSEDGVYHLVVIPVEIVSEERDEVFTGFSYFRILEYDGELRISYEEFFD